MAEEWISTREAAEIIGVTVQHVNYLLRHGHIAGKKFGYFWMANKGSVEDYASKERKRGPKPKNP